MDFSVQPKKSLGQHFLKDDNIARKIITSLPQEAVNVIEVGPGMGVLTKFLIQDTERECYFIETDRQSVEYLKSNYPDFSDRFIQADFLKANLARYFPDHFSVIGNFPYNISSQIFFKVLEYRDQVDFVVGMIQKEVAERIASGPGTKKYGILSVLLQAFYKVEYLFQVNETVFYPQPKVKSAVIRLTRNNVSSLECDERVFFKVVKAAFNQRRKTIRNSLREYYIDYSRDLQDLETKRPEQLGVNDFVRLTRQAI